MSCRFILLVTFILSALGFEAKGATNTSVPAEAYFRYTPEAFRKLPAAQQKISFQRLNIPLINAAVFHETNVRRVKHGVEPLKYNAQAQQTAAMQTQAMAFHDFISHENNFDPKKKTLSDRLNLVKVSPQFAAENLATAFALNYESGTSVYVREEGGKTIYSVKPDGPALELRSYQQFAEKVLDSWMNSPGHRKNVLNPTAELLGVSCLPEKKEDGIRKFYCTQIFLKL
ncbi:MAG: CAP domain-containing protein [Verrucomicrobiales bacterium]